MIKYMDETSELGKIFEGFDNPNHNDPEQRKRASMFAKALNVKGRAIDIGYGSNLSVARGFIDAGLEAYALDKKVSEEIEERFGVESGLDEKPRLIYENEGIKILLGDVDKLDLPEKFDLAVFWGSWSSAGNNFSIEETALSKYYQNHPELIGTKEYSLNEETTKNVYAKEKTTVLEKLVKHMNPGGIIAIVSSNYARHGEGFDPERYNNERTGYLKALEYLKELGAKELYLIGDSKQKSLQLMRESFSDEITKMFNNARNPSANMPKNKEIRLVMPDKDDVKWVISKYGDEVSAIITEIKQTDLPIIHAKAAVARF